MKPCRPTALPTLVLALACALPLLSEGQAAPEAPTVSLLPASVEAVDAASQKDAAAFGAALRDALALALEREGFSVIQVGGSEPPAPASEAGASGDAWTATIRLGLARSRISYRVSVFEAREGALVAAEAFSTYAGLGALPLMAESARRAAAKAAGYRASIDPAERSGGPRIIPYRIAVVSRDEGATVGVRDPVGGEAISAGIIEGGRLSLPYLPIEEGSRILIELSAAGKNPSTMSAVVGAEPMTLAAPRLSRIERQALSVETGPGRLIGLGLGYRLFLRPDWIFAFLDGRAFAGYDFLPRSFPVYHAELWLGLGSYVISRPGSPLRLGLCAGAGSLFSSSAAIGEGDRAFVDLALIPLEGFAECRLVDSLSLRLSARSAFSLGLDSGLVARGWMGSPLPLLFSLGLSWGF
jgi:hypothetical protein